MKSEWKITSNLIDGKMFYGVYRLLNMNEVDHSGNREHHGDFVQDRGKAVGLAEKLNKGEEGEGSAGTGHLGICCACFSPIQDEAFQFREKGRKFHPECAKKADNYYIKLEKKLALKERVAKLDQKETDEKAKTCPRCGKPMEEFAQAWGWEHCFDCSAALRKAPLPCNVNTCRHNRKAEGLPSICACYAEHPGTDETGQCKYFVARGEEQ